jgi:hypothetical protein
MTPNRSKYLHLLVQKSVRVPRPQWHFQVTCSALSTVTVAATTQKLNGGLHIFTRLRTRTSVHHSHANGHHKMVPNPAPPPSATITEPLPPLSRSTTLPLYSYRPITTDRTLLTPEDAIYHGSPPRKQSPAVSRLAKDLRMTPGTNGSTTGSSERVRHKDRTRSGSRRRKRTWKKLLWVKQSCAFCIALQRTLLM